MSNNPILNMDVLGDTTTYYDNHGSTFYTTYAKGYNNAFIGGDDFLDAAKTMFGKLGELDLGQQKVLDGAIIGLNNIIGFGDAYDLQSITQFYDENISKHSISKIDGIPIDKMDIVKLDGKSVSKSHLKSLKGAEATFDMVKKGGVWTVDKNSVTTKNSFNTADQGSSSRPNGHLHPNVRQFNGRVLSYTYDGRENVLGKINGSGITSGPDMDGAKTQGKLNGTVRNVVVTSNAIYLYNGTINQQIRRN